MWKVVLMVLACGLLEPSVAHEIVENTAEHVAYDHFLASKIAEGKPANKTLKTDYVLLSVIFVNQAQICGGTLVTDSWVLTSATCLQDPVEGVASFVYAAIGGSGKPTLTHQRIVINPDYDALTYKNDIALLKLSVPVKVDGKKIVLATRAVDVTADVYLDQLTVFCGWGTTQNKPTPSKGMQCTTLKVVAAATCNANTFTVCTKGAINDANVCPGDFGGPLYLISGTTQTVIGIASSSPDIRAATPCRDGHLTAHTQVAGFTDWILEVTVT